MNNTVQFKSCAVNASAGFGKTENLAVRFIGMLLAADNPETSLSTIVAMTFTRAAAMEIYERVVLILCGALKNGMDGLNRKLQSSGVTATREQTERLLKLLILYKNRLNISTIDSFMLNIASAFPFELGFPGAPEIISGFDSERISIIMIGRLLGEAAGDEAEELREACREALVESAAGKQLFTVAEELLLQAKTYYAWRNQPECWERFADIRLDKRTAAADFSIWESYRNSDAFAKDRAKPRGMELHNLMEKCRDINEYTGFSSAELASLREIFKSWEDFDCGELKPDGFAFMNKFPAECRMAVKRLLKLAADLLILRSGRRTAAIRKLLADYSDSYRREVLARGMAGFSDLPLILCDHGNDWVYDIHFRLNSRLRHWLIDEFQDTGMEQLEVFNSIIDELPEDEARSLYIVGDVKQAIYGWRSGDYRLMAAEKKRFCLQDETLPHSYRYGLDICHGLNTIFAPEALAHAAIPELTAKDWNAAWTRHTPGRDVDGCMEILQLQPESTMEFAELINTRLEELKWQERAMQCAILVRDNKEGMELKEALINLNPALQDKLTWEGEESIASDYFIAALLELMVYLQHPGDTLSLFAAEMHPEVAGRVPRNRRVFAHDAELLSRGIYKFLTYTLAGIRDNASAKREFSENIELLLTAARDFDRINAFKDAINFRSFVNDYKKSSTALAGKIKMMTIHHSKGLTFDAVFLPLKNSNSWTTVPTRGFMRSEEEEFILFNPGAEGFTEPSLARLMHSTHSRRVFEELCVLYVGLTRARRAVFVLLPAPAKEKRKLYCKWSDKAGESTYIKDNRKMSYYPADLVFESCFKLNDITVMDESFPQEQVLTGRFGTAWYKSEPVKPRQVQSSPVWPELAPGGVRHRMPRIMPVPHEETVSSLLQLRDSGTEEHNNRMRRQFMSEFVSGGYSSDGWLKSCLEVPLTASLLQFAGTRWIGRKFDVIIDDRQISGCFDLVNIAESGGVITEVQQIMFDFSANADESYIREKYRDIIAIYNQALAGILQVDPDSVTGIVINPPSGIAVIFQK